MNEKISSIEAIKMLRKLEATQTRARNQVFADFSSIPLMIWGAIWAFLHLNGTLYLHRGHDIFGKHPDASAPWIIWTGLAGTLAFVFLKLRYANPVRSEGSWLVRYRAPLLVFVWFIFHFLTSRLRHFENGLQENAHNSMYWMLLFIVYGFWMANGMFLVIGLLVSCWALIGYCFLPEHYGLLMGLGAGGTLFVGGLFPLLRSRGLRQADEGEE